MRCSRFPITPRCATPVRRAIRKLWALRRISTDKRASILQTRVTGVPQRPIVHTAEMAKNKRKRTPKAVLKLPDLEQSKSAVLNSLTSLSSQRSYDHAIREFIEWYCSEPRLAFNKTVVTRYPHFSRTGSLRLLHHQSPARSRAQARLRGC
jgi:hypothetical protein